MKNIKEERLQKNTSVSSTEVIKPMDLLQEIEPLLREYFIGNFGLKNEEIIMNFDNGQIFRLFVEEMRRTTKADD